MYFLMGISKMHNNIPIWLYNFPLKVIKYWYIWFGRKLTFYKKISRRCTYYIYYLEVIVSNH